MAHPLDEILWALSADALASACAHRARSRLKGAQDSLLAVERALSRTAGERNRHVSYDEREGRPARP